MADRKWGDVAKFCKEEIERLHLALETQQQDVATETLRGEIRALRRILALGDDPKPQTPETMIQPETEPYEGKV